MFKVKDLNSYTKQLKLDNPYLDMSYSPNKNVADAMTRYSSDYLPMDNSRGMLDRVFDLISAPLYSTAGIVRGAIDPNLSMWEGFTGGLKASNPFGQGYEKGEHTYSKVLESAGWKPQSTFGKIAKGTLGFVGDVFLDPLTYVSGGTSAVIRGTGKAGAKLTHGGVIALEGAEELVKNYNKAKNIVISADDVAKDAEKVMKEYNRIAGLRTANVGSTLSLANAPFGKKIFGKYADNSIELVSKETLENFGEKTIAPHYAKLRNSIYGSKFGEMFSTTSKIYQASKTNPEAVYEFIQFTEHTRGLTKNTIEAEKAIREKAKILDLNEAETKEVLQMMQDKTVWHKIAQTVKFLDTAEVKQMRDKVAKSYEHASEKLSGLLSKKTTLESFKHAKDMQIDDLDGVLKDMDGELKAELMNIDTTKFNKAKQFEDLIKTYDEQIKELKDYAKAEEEGISSKTILSNYDYHLKRVADRNARITELKKQNSIVTKGDDIKDLEKSEILSDMRHKRIIDEVDKKGYVSYKTGKQVADFEASYPGWEKVVHQVKGHTDETGNIVRGYTETRFIPPDNFKTKVQTPSAIAFADDLQTVDKGMLVRQISENLYGKSDMLSESIFDSDLDNLMNMIREDKSKDEMIAYIEKNADKFSGKSSTMYKFIANYMGYDSWEKHYTIPIKQIEERTAKNGGVMSLSDSRTYAKLKQDEMKRSYLVSKLKHTKSLTELTDITTEMANAKMMEEYRSVDNMSYTTGHKSSATSEDILRQQGLENQSALIQKNKFAPHNNSQIIKGLEKELINASPEEAEKLNKKIRQLKVEQSERHIIDGKNLTHTDNLEKQTKWITTEQHNQIIDDIVDDVFFKKTAKHYNDVNKAKIKGTDKLAEKIDKNITERTSKDFTENTVAWARKVANEVEPLLKNQFGVTFDKLSDKQKKLLYYMATQNANLRENGLKLMGGVLPKKQANAIALEAKKAVDDAKIEGIVKTVKNGDTISALINEKKGVKGVVESIQQNADGTTTYNITLPDGSLYKGVEPLQVRRVTTNASIRTVEEIMVQSTMTKHFVERADELTKLVEEAKVGLKSLDVEYDTSYHKVLNDFTQRAEQVRENIKQIEIDRQTFIDALSKDEGNIDALSQRVKRLEDVLASDDAFESYAKMLLGVKGVEQVIKNNNPRMGEIILDPSLQASEKVTKAVEMLREEFIKMGNSEVRIEKLKQEQIDALLYEYLPHIITPEGSKLFASNPEIVKMIPNFGDDLGYGRKFNPYAKSRQIKYLPNVVDAQGNVLSWHENPTIEQINEFFKPMTQGKNVFSENIADIYITRALKNTELMYDNEYMNTMIHKFGKDIVDGKIEKGYKAVANYGKLKDVVRKTAKTKATLELQNMSMRGDSIGADTFKQLMDFHIKKTLAEMGLKPEILDDLAVPMVELNSEQITKINSFDPSITKQVNDVIVQKANQSRKLQIAKDQSRFLQLYDKFTHLIKLNQTTVLPSFHARNKMSNTFNNWLAIGKDVVNVDFQKNSFMAMKNEGKLDAILDIVNKDGTKSKMTWNEVYEKAKQYGAIDDGFFAKDIGVGTQTNGMIKKLSPKFDPTDTKNFILYKKGAEIGGLIEGQDRLLHFASEVSRGASFEEATESVNKFLFDYSDLTAFEASVMKRIIPYYTWLRKNAPLQLEQMMIDPKKYLYVSKVMGGIEGMNNEEDRINKGFVNDFAKDWVQTPFSVTNPEGRQEPVLWNPNLPFMDLGRIPDIMNPVQSAKNIFTQMNPLIKTPIEQLMNRNVYFDSPIVKEGENQIAKRFDHVASQDALYNTIGGLFSKKGADLGLHVLNNTTGVKLLSYDYEKYKVMKLDEMRKAGRQEPSIIDNVKTGISDGLETIGKSIIQGFKGAFSSASNTLGDAVTQSRPLNPNEYTDALRPISQSKYEALSDEDKKMYTPPTKDNVMAYNKKAIELSEQAYKESSAVKKFTWALFDGLDWGKRNKDFKLGEVVNVRDGDTFDVKIGDETKGVRLLLVDTPETVDPRMSEPMPYGKESSDYSKKELFGKDVRLYFDGTIEDKYGRYLAYVEVDGEDYNNKLLKEGLAQMRYNMQPPYDRYGQYKKTERDAYNNKTGLWSAEGYATPGVDDGYNMYAKALERRLNK